MPRLSPKTIDTIAFITIYALSALISIGTIALLVYIGTR